MSQRQYRALRKDNGKPVYGWYVHFHNFPMKGDGIIEGGWDSKEHDLHVIFDTEGGLTNPFDWEGTIHRGSYVEVIESTVGQWTGRKDGQGTKIYAGDKMTWHDATVPKGADTQKTVVVKWSNSAARFINCFVGYVDGTIHDEPKEQGNG